MTSHTEASDRNQTYGLKNVVVKRYIFGSRRALDNIRTCLVTAILDGKIENGPSEDGCAGDWWVGVDGRVSGCAADEFGRRC